MAKLYFFYSAMDAGKTTHLLQNNYNYLNKKINTLLFIPSVANSEGLIKSRIGLCESAIKITDSFNIFLYVKNYKKEIKYIFIDEAQFLKKKHIFQLISIVDNLNISVFTYGLRTDFRAKLFEGSKYLLALSDDLIELKTICVCGKKASMNLRIDNFNKKILHGNQIEIDKGKYLSLCRYHYYNIEKL